MSQRVTDRIERVHRKMLAPRPPAPGSAPLLSLKIDDRNQRETSSRRRSTKPRPIACQSCRHAKLRCEDSAGGTRPCQRCRDLTRPCIVDKSYKRANKKSIPFNQPKYQAGQQPPELVEFLPIEHIATRNIEQIDRTDRSPVSQGQGATASNATNSPRQLSDSPERPVFEDSGKRIPADLGHESPQTSEQYHCTAQHERTIETITITPEQIQHFFNVYFSYYHPALPIVKPPDSADLIYEVSPPLFWTIIMTAARHDQTDFSLTQSLSPTVRTLLWSTIANPPQDLPSLQAMCIVCAWPFPASSMSQDITYLVGGLLKIAALQAGLHQPDVYAHFSRTRYSLSPEEQREAARVWCCIYIAIESLAVTAGHLPHIYADRTIEQASIPSNPYNLPPTLHQAVAVQLFCNKLHSTMGDLDRMGTTTARPHRASSLRLLEADLQELDRRLGPSKCHRINIELLSAAFQLRGYWLLEPDESSSRRDGIVRAYDNVLDLASEIQAGDKSDVPLQFSTWSTYMMCVAGAAFISKVVHSSYRSYIDVDKGKNAFNTCLLVLRQCSAEDNDLPGRSSRLISQLWNIHQAQSGANDKPPTLKIASRMFYSIVYDSTWLWREKYGDIPGNGAPKLPPPFIPTSSSSSSHKSSAIPPSQSPVISTSNPRSNPRTNVIESPTEASQVVKPPQVLNAFSHDILINPPDVSADTVAEDFDPTWDIGFLTPNATNFNLPLSDFNMAPIEPSW